MLLCGTRLKYVLRTAASWSPEKVVKHPTDRLEKRSHRRQGRYRYYLVIQEGSKRTDHVCFPLAGGMRVPALSYRQLRDRINDLGVKAGLYREFTK